jgi:hypothetical protein
MLRIPAPTTTLDMPRHSFRTPSPLAIRRVLWIMPLYMALADGFMICIRVYCRHRVSMVTNQEHVSPIVGDKGFGAHLDCIDRIHDSMFLVSGQLQGPERRVSRMLRTAIPAKAPAAMF